MKIKLKEINGKVGFYEEKVIPGNYLLDIKRPGYETYKSQIELQAGGETLHIELQKEKATKIVVAVYNYESMQPLENVNLKVLYI
jgi:hypothetical protein